MVPGPGRRLRVPDGPALGLRDTPLHRALHRGTVAAQELLLEVDGLPDRFVRCDGRAVTDAEGRVLGAVVAMTDVTDLRAVERGLREAHDALARSEALFRRAFERGPTPLCRLSLDGRVLASNPALRRLLAVTSKRLAEGRLVDLVHPEDRERLDAALAEADDVTGSSTVEAGWCASTARRCGARSR